MIRKKRWAMALALVCAIGFAFIMVSVMQKGVTVWDEWGQAHITADALSGPSIWLSAVNLLGSTAAFGAITIGGSVLVWSLRRRKEAVALLGTVAAAYLLNIVVKSWVGRERPQHEGWLDASGLSFPSGNAMIGMVLYGMLAYILASSIRSRMGQWCVMLIGVLVILGIGYSRLYFGVHYVTDIAAGYLAGLFCIAVACLLVGERKPSGSGYTMSPYRYY
ncbi:MULTISPECIES: phosphatase PAP2 family protein [unclassified Paenibacillus]|uniref:phosphatase PAP2 family protein n=1 Tax=unclassified Paenibacillus TaxID=185978 RepID=UPI001AE5BA26|nr:MULTISPECIES: phosphatase PAP2 family protein [unclassified Paenibacillus]MBP1155417.1 undecaprenyl-diphosphatase [Paenibacillus sp. PvP091]MBP1169198.1 undecaprenyl-diphosphatase [Paenibacillus sp. PvR098]MBP2440226.1 undecaprenyl-diphosphatase [Paenibacillus sp. PvP052]